MVISKPRLSKDGSRVRLTACVEFENNKRDLWYSVPSEFADLLDVSAADAFVVGLLPIAMQSGEGIVVRDAPVSERLLWNLEHGLQSILRAIVPSLSKVDVQASYNGPRKLDTKRSGLKLHLGHGVATGFSGGIDSFCVLADYWYGSPPSGLKITYLIYNNVGSHGRRGRDLFHERFQRLQPRSLGLPYVAIDSNLDAHYAGRRLGFQQTHTLRNASAVLALQNGVGTYLYASAFPYTECFVGKTKDIAHADPTLLPLLSTDTMEMIGVGSEYSRVEKTRIVSELPASYDYLDVCGSGDAAGNCSSCWKCGRTEVTLEILGRLQHYSGVFELERYRKDRALVIARVLARGDRFADDIRQLSRAAGSALPLESRVLAFAMLGIRRTVDFARRSQLARHLRSWVRGRRVKRTTGSRRDAEDGRSG